MIANQRYGNLVTVEPINGGKFWLCRCDCGNTTKASKWHLIRNKRRSCGCRLNRPDTYTCNVCNQLLNRSEFYIRKTGQVSAITCKSCSKSRVNARLRGYRKLVFDHYGNSCACCGESNYHFLTIDHVNNDGAEHRKEIGRNIERWIIKNKYPAGFQTLCYNCNCAKGKLGYCPHQVISS